MQSSLYIRGLNDNSNINYYHLFNLLNDLIPIDDNGTIEFKEYEKIQIINKLNFVKMKSRLLVTRDKMKFNDLSPSEYLEFMFMNKKGKPLTLASLANKCLNIPYTSVNLVLQLLFRIVIFSPNFIYVPTTTTTTVRSAQKITPTDEYLFNSKDVVPLLHELDELNFLPFLENVDVNELVKKQHPILEIYDGSDLNNPVMTHETSSVTSISRKMRIYLCKTWLHDEAERNAYLKLDDKFDTEIEPEENDNDDDEKMNRSTGISSKIDAYTSKALSAYLQTKTSTQSSKRKQNPQTIEYIETFEKKMFYISLGKTASDLMQGLLTDYINDNYAYFPVETLTMDQQFALICSLENIPVLFEIPKSGMLAAMQIFPGSLLPPNIMKFILKDRRGQTLGIISDNNCKSENILFKVSENIVRDKNEKIIEMLNNSKEQPLLKKSKSDGSIGGWTPSKQNKNNKNNKKTNKNNNKKTNKTNKKIRKHKKKFTCKYKYKYKQTHANSSSKHRTIRRKHKRRKYYTRLDY